MVAELDAEARADAPRTPNVPLGSVLRRNRALRRAWLLFERAKLAADATRAAAEGLAESEAEAAAADPIGIVAPDDQELSLFMLDPTELPRIPMATIWRIRRTEIRNRRVPRLA